MIKHGAYIREGRGYSEQADAYEALEDVEASSPNAYIPAAEFHVMNGHV